MWRLELLVERPYSPFDEGILHSWIWGTPNEVEGEEGGFNTNCHSRRFKGERPIGAATGEQSQPPRPCANPPPLCISDAKVPNQYRPYACCSLDKAVDARVQKERIAW